jgi:hypothetical protein
MKGSEAMMTPNRLSQLDVRCRHREPCSVQHAHKHDDPTAIGAAPPRSVNTGVTRRWIGQECTLDTRQTCMRMVFT